MRLNSAKIQSAAALMPVPAGRSVSLEERVERLWKETSFSMSAWIWAGSILARAAAMAGSARGTVMGVPAGVWASAFEAREARVRQRTQAEAIRCRRIMVLWSPWGLSGAAANFPQKVCFAIIPKALLSL